MKNLFTILFLLSAVHCYAQTETKEDFINQVYDEIVYRGDRNYYYLFQDAKLSVTDDIIEGYIQSYGKRISTELSKELTEKFKRRKAENKWDFTKLMNVRPFDNDSALLPLLCCTIRMYGTEESKEQKDTIGNLYHFSQPIFDSTYQYAVIWDEYVCGGFLCGQGWVYFFRKEKNRWTAVTRDMWMMR